MKKAIGHGLWCQNVVIDYTLIDLLQHWKNGKTELIYVSKFIYWWKWPTIWWLNRHQHKMVIFITPLKQSRSIKNNILVLCLNIMSLLWWQLFVKLLACCPDYVQAVLFYDVDHENHVCWIILVTLYAANAINQLFYHCLF